MVSKINTHHLRRWVQIVHFLRAGKCRFLRTPAQGALVSNRISEAEIALAGSMPGAFRGRTPSGSFQLQTTPVELPVARSTTVPVHPYPKTPVLNCRRLNSRSSGESPDSPRKGLAPSLHFGPKRVFSEGQAIFHNRPCICKCIARVARAVRNGGERFLTS